MPLRKNPNKHQVMEKVFNNSFVIPRKKKKMRKTKL